MPLLYSGTSLRRVNAGTEITAAGRVLSARANPPVLWALAVLRPHYRPDGQRSAGVQVSMLAVLTLLAPNICWAGARFMRWSRRALDA